MRFLIDENMHGEVGRVLAEYGHDVVQIARSQWRGISDPQVWELARALDRILVTGDKGFPLRDAGMIPGLVLFRYHTTPSIREARRLTEEVVMSGALDSCLGNVVVASPGQIRVRALEQYDG